MYKKVRQNASGKFVSCHGAVFWVNTALASGAFVSDSHSNPEQLEFPFADSSTDSAAAKTSARSTFRVIEGGGERQQEPLLSRDAVVRILVETGADLLLRRISSERAEAIQREVDTILVTFDRVDRQPELMPMLERQLLNLEQLMSETRSLRRQGARR